MPSLIFNFIFLPVFLNFAISQKSMTLLWGKPGTYSFSTRFTVDDMSWKQCIQYCYDMNSCIVAHNRGDQNNITKFGGCQIFQYNWINNIKKLNSTNSLGAQVAIKVILANSSTCPVGKNAPLFKKSSIQAEVDNPAKPSLKPGYTITSNDSFWFFNYTIQGQCTRADFFLRTSGSVCVCYFTSWDGYSLKLANEFCKNRSAIIAGIDNYPEFKNYIHQIQSNTNKSNVTEQIYWLDGMRTAQCQVKNWAKLSQCNSFNAFNFSDPYHTNTEEYEWEDGAPFGENCLGLWVRSDSNPSRIGKVRDLSCTAPCTKTMCPTGVGCLKLAGSG